MLLKARTLAKSFRGVKALAGVDVEVRRGEILGLLGPNGSGKSTFINVVSGHYVPSAGSVVFEGRELAGRAAHRIARAGIARTYQIPRPFGRLNVLDNVALAAMFGVGLPNPEAARREAMAWLAFAGLEAKAQALPDELNLHQRKFLELARALASRPRLVLLDEVLCGLTPAEIDDAVALVRRIRDQGATVVFVEHVMRAVMALTDRVVVFDHDELLAEGPASDVMQRPSDERLGHLRRRRRWRARCRCRRGNTARVTPDSPARATAAPSTTRAAPCLKCTTCKWPAAPAPLVGVTSRGLARAGYGRRRPNAAPRRNTTLISTLAGVLRAQARRIVFRPATSPRCRHAGAQAEPPLVPKAGASSAHERARRTWRSAACCRQRRRSCAPSR
ncbi:MAG: ABC transporter ATP-binding protein [Rubrivivax sp.]